MTTYFVRRLLWLIPVIFFVSLITFTLMHKAPGGPWDRDLSSRQVDKTHPGDPESAVRPGQTACSQSAAAAIRWIASSGNYLLGLVHGIWDPPTAARPGCAGYSVQGPRRQAVLGKPVRLLGSPGSFCVGDSCRFGHSPRRDCGAHRNTIIDYFTLFLSTIGVSVPSFVLAIFLIILIVVVKGSDRSRSSRQIGATRARGSSRR